MPVLRVLALSLGWVLAKMAVQSSGMSSRIPPMTASMTPASSRGPNPA